MAIGVSQTIRPLGITDATAYHQLRLKTLRASPECFCTSLEEASRLTVDDHRKLIRTVQESPKQFLFGAFDQHRLIGAVGVEQLNGLLRIHRARVWGLLVDCDFRRRGTARTLCAQAIEQARQLGVEKVSLELTGEAVAALHLYRSLGFRIESVEPLALKLEGRYLDEIRMSLCF